VGSLVVAADSTVIVATLTGVSGVLRWLMSGAGRHSSDRLAKAGAVRGALMRALGTSKRGRLPDSQSRSLIRRMRIGQIAGDTELHNTSRQSRDSCHYAHRAPVCAL